MSSYKPYTLQKTESGSMFVMSKDYRGMNFILPFVSQELKEKSFAGFIVFDLLLSNGNNTGRYFQIYFDGRDIKKESIKKLFPAPQEYKTMSNKFLKRHPEVLNNGVLTQTDIRHFTESLK